MIKKEDFEMGFKAREEVLGKENVEAFISATNEFNLPFHELAMEYCWGEIWNRPGLERKTRSLLNIAILTAIGNTHELQVHLQGAIKNGCSKEEIQEVLLQCTVYCGVPTGGAGFNVAKAFFEKLENNVEDGE